MSSSENSLNLKFSEARRVCHCMTALIILHLLDRLSILG